MQIFTRLEFIGVLIKAHLPRPLRTDVASFYILSSSESSWTMAHRAEEAECLPSMTGTDGDPLDVHRLTVDTSGCWRRRLMTALFSGCWCDATFRQHGTSLSSIIGAGDDTLDAIPDKASIFTRRDTR